MGQTPCSALFERRDSIVEYSLDPRVWNLVQVLLNFLLREAFIHPAQEVSHSVVFTLLVLQGEVVASESSYPPLPSSIQIGRGEDVSERVVVCADYKLVPVLPIWGQIFMELLCNGPLKGQEFLFVGVVPLFSIIHHMAGIGDRMVSSICLLLRQYSPEASSRGIGFQQEQLVEVWKGQDRSLEASGLETLKGFPCLQGQVNVFRLLVLVLPTSEVIQWRCNFGKALYEVLVMTYKAHKRLHFGVGIWGWTLSN